MATEVMLVKDGNRLAAADPISQETLDGMKRGEVVKATIRRPRNPRHHAKFFVLLSIVFENQERYKSLDNLLDAIKIETGHYELLTLPGKIPLQVCKPKSISFAAMDQAEFEKFYDRVIAFVVTDVLPGMERRDLENRVIELISN